MRSDSIAKTTDLTRGRLRALRDAIVARRLDDGSEQSTWTINDSLKKAGPMFNYFADRDMLSVSDRDIRKG